MPSLPTAGQKPWDLNSWLLVGHDAAGNNLGAGPDAAKVDKDSVVVAATRILENKLLAGHAQPAFRMLGDGKLSWGPGSSTAPDTNLYRSAAGMLKTDGALTVANNMVIDSANLGYSLDFGTVGDVYMAKAAPGRLQVSSTDFRVPKLLIGATDTNLYRLSANSLKTDGVFTAVGSIVRADAAGGVGFHYNPATAGGAAFYSSIAAEANARFRFSSEGLLAWGPGGATATDTSLYRWGVGMLKTDGYMVAAIFSVEPGSAGDSWAYTTKIQGDTQPRYIVSRSGQLSWGPGGTTATDTDLFRSAAGILKTNGAFRVGTDLHVGHSTATPIIYFGSDADLNLQKVAAGQLRCSGIFEAMSYVTVNSGAAGQIWLHPDGGIYFSNLSDTVLKRSAAGTLKTDGHFHVAGNLMGGGRVGEYAKYPLNMDWNNAIENGWWMASTALNAPLGDQGWWMGEVICHNNIWTVQRAWNFTGGNGSPVYQRRQLNGVWSPWEAENLYRVDTATQRMNDNLLVGGELAVGFGQAWQVYITKSGSNPVIYFGSASDTYLYRSAAGVLKTDGEFKAGGPVRGSEGASQVIIGDVFANTFPTVGFGTSGDAIYRDGAGNLAIAGMRLDVDPAGIRFSDGSIQTKAVDPAYQGAYAAGTAYKDGDVVAYNGALYMCITPVTGSAPEDWGAFPPGDTGWTAMSLANGSHYGVPYGPCGYRKLANGMVICRGLYIPSGPGVVVFTFPVGYRPAASHTLIFACAGSPAPAGESFRVEPAGNITTSGGIAAGGWHSLANISFLAET